MPKAINLAKAKAKLRESLPRGIREASIPPGRVHPVKLLRTAFGGFNRVNSRRGFARPVKSVGLFGGFLKSAAIIFCAGFSSQRRVSLGLMFFCIAFFLFGLAGKVWATD